MCGIAGFFGEGTREELEAMLAGVKHRGPDDSGMFLEKGVGLAHARLAIIDISPAGHQPMELPDKSVAIILNGEIYNYKELREDLIKRGCQFRSTSDTEVLLWLYKLDGENFLKNCVGMFSLALYDRTAHKLVLARDRIGEKPLYWSNQSDTVLFASEMRGLLASKRIARKLDHESLAHYLAHDYVPTPMSMIEGVYKLEPATMLVCTAERQEKKKYWEPPQHLSADPLPEATQILEKLLERSVTRELAASDVPTGVFLSGGLDSSTIAYFAQKSSSRPIDTFSIAFDDPSFDESRYAREVAQLIGSNHHEEKLSPDAALELIEEIPNVLSEPIADASVLPTMLLSRFARKSVTVALGGDGGDELFAGYPTFQADRLFHMLPRGLRHALSAVQGVLPPSHANFSFSYNLRKFLSSEATDAIERHLEWLGSFSAVELGELLKNKHGGNVFEYARAYAREMPENDAGNKLLYTYARTYLMDEVLVKVDRASMQYALETRAPFLDHTIVDYVFSLPYSYKYKNGTTKYILKKIMENKLPNHIVRRKKKGFGVPLARWLTGPLRPLCEELLSPHSLRKHGLFNQTYVDTLVRDHMEGSRDNRKELWNLMVFQLWYNRWLR